MKRELLRIVVTSNGQRIGTMTPGEFLKHSGAPTHTFLTPAIEKFNAWKTQIGEPERVHSELVK